MNFNDPTCLAFYVRAYQEVLDPEFCNDLIDKYRENKNWDDGRMVSDDGNKLSKEFRSCRTLNLTEENEYVGKVHEAVGDTLVSYYSYLNDNNVIVPRISGWQNPCLLHYRKGDFLKEHNDSGPENLRTLSVILNLSDKHEGGYFSFFGDRLRLKLGVGEALIFPSCFSYPHAVTEVTDGERYSIITWCK